jgi:excisionase family DNA binding protein
MNKEKQGKGPEVGPAYLSPKQAAQYLGISLSSLYRAINAGTLKVYRPVPDAPRLKVSDLEALPMAKGAA